VVSPWVTSPRYGDAVAMTGTGSSAALVGRATRTKTRSGVPLSSVSTGVWTQAVSQVTSTPSYAVGVPESPSGGSDATHPASAPAPVTADTLARTSRRESTAPSVPCVPAASSPSPAVGFAILRR
jgi:hypothetical protein